jgi:hypothetical protein
MDKPTLFGDPQKIINAVFGLVGVGISFFTYSKVHSVWPSVVAGAAFCITVHLVFRFN